MCSADITPIELYYSPWLNRSTPNFATKHTCRNWNSLQAWSIDKLQSAMERYGVERLMPGTV